MAVFGPPQRFIRQQRALKFWDDTPHSIEERRAAVDPSNPDSYFARFIGNRDAVNLLSAAAFSALGDQYHRCGEALFALIGPSGSGKRTLARIFARVVGLPFVELRAEQLNEANEVLVGIAKVLEETWVDDPVDGKVNLELVSEFDQGTSQDNTRFHVPPCIVFIHDLDLLQKRVLHGLLNAIEPGQRMLVTEKGWRANTDSVCWIAAATKADGVAEGILRRFTTITFGPYSEREVVQIVRFNNPELPVEACAWAAVYCGGLLRVAVQFAKALRDMHEMHGGMSWEETAFRCAKYYKLTTEEGAMQ